MPLFHRDMKSNENQLYLFHKNLQSVNWIQYYRIFAILLTWLLKMLLPDLQILIVLISASVD